MFHTSGSPPPGGPGRPLGAQGASDDSPRDRLSPPLQAQREMILQSLEVSGLGADGAAYFKTGDRGKNEERVRSFMTHLGEKDLGYEYNATVKREFRRHCLPSLRRPAEPAIGDPRPDGRERPGRHETGSRREPKQAKTPRPNKEAKPLAPAPPDRADTADDLRAMVGTFARKSDEYLNAFLAYLGPKRSKEDVTKAFPGFRALRAASGPPARPALPKGPGFHGGALAKQREKHLQELNKIGDDGLTKLMRAVMSRDGTEETRAKAVEDLLKGGADPRLSAKWPVKASDAELSRLQWAADYYCANPSKNKSYDFVSGTLFKVFPSLREGHVARYAGMNALTMAVACKAGDRIVSALSKALTQRKEGLDTPEAGGHTSLTLAVEANDPKRIALLIQEGADIDAPDSHGRTPLMLAARMNNLDLVKLLTDAGANYLASAPDHVTPLSLAIDGASLAIDDASKKNLAARVELLDYLLLKIENLCQNFDDEGEPGHSDRVETLAKLLHGLRDFEGEAFEGSAVKAHGADCLRKCIGFLNVVNLLELLPHFDGPVFDEMEEAVWKRFPLEFEPMFGAAASPLNLWIKTSKALAKYASIAEKKGRPLGIGFSLNFMTRALDSICKTSNAFDSLALLRVIIESARTTKAHMGAAKTLLDLLPSKWEQLLRSSAEDSKIKEESPELKANLIATLARLGRRDKRLASIARAFVDCERKMWALASQHFASDELSGIIKGAGEPGSDSEGRVGWRPSFDVLELLGERRASIEALDRAGGSGETGDAADLFVNSFRLALLLLGDDSRFGSSLGLYPEAVQSGLAVGYAALTKKTKQEILQRLGEEEVVILRDWVESHGPGVFDDRGRNRDSALKEIDKFGRKK